MGKRSLLRLQREDIKIQPRDVRELVGEAVLLTDSLTEKYLDEQLIYMSFRACGYTREESLHHAGLPAETLENWYQNPDFKKKDTYDICYMRRKWAKHALVYTFMRNFRLIMLKDQQIIQKSIDSPEAMTKPETDYLVRLRTAYDLDRITESMMIEANERDEDPKEKALDWATLVTRISQRVGNAEVETEVLNAIAPNQGHRKGHAVFKPRKAIDAPEAEGGDSDEPDGEIQTITETAVPPDQGQTTCEER